MTTTTQREELQGAVLGALEAMSQNELARKMQISAATVIAIKGGDWEKVSDKMVRQCRAYFRLDDWAIRNTRNFSRIKELCDDARTNRRMVAAAGYTGAGKTTSLKHEAANNPGTYYVLAKPYHKPRSFMQAIQRAMGIGEGYSTAEIIGLVTARMLNTDNCVLLIDDAGKLNSDCMRIIQCLYDDTEGQAGIVLAGTEYLKSYIDSQAKANVRGFREFKRRIAYWLPMVPASRKEVQTICADYGITNKHAVQYIYENATNYKVLADMIQNSLKVAQAHGEEVSREILSDLHLGDHAYNAVA